MEIIYFKRFKYSNSEFNCNNNINLLDENQIFILIVRLNQMIKKNFKKDLISKQKKNEAFRFKC